MFRSQLKSRRVLQLLILCVCLLFSRSLLAQADLATTSEVRQNNANTYRNIPTLQYSEREITTMIQTQLNRLGCTLGVADGIVGRRSVASMRALLAASDLGLDYSGALFVDYGFLQSLEGLSGPVCLTDPVPEPASIDLSGVWEANFECPNNRSFTGNSEIYGRNRAFYRIRYWDNAGVGQGSGNLRGRTFSGSIRYEGEEISFSYNVSTSGRALTGTTVTSSRNRAVTCNVSARFLYR